MGQMDALQVNVSLSRQYADLAVEHPICEYDRKSDIYVSSTERCSIIRQLACHF